VRPSPIAIALVVALLGPAASHSARAQAADPAPATMAAPPDTLDFSPLAGDSAIAQGAEPDHGDGGWRRRTPFGEGLLTARRWWRGGGSRLHGVQTRLDYDRVDRLRLGAGYQFQARDAMAPRFGTRLEYAFGRDRLLYGFQLEQPLVRPGRIAFGASLVRRTDHNELQQVDDLENTLALLLWRYDFRDYFERDGLGAYLSWYVPDFSTVSIHLRRDAYRSLPLDPHTPSWFHRARPLRDNPAIDGGETHSVALRFESGRPPRRNTRAGLTHWLEVERAGRALGGDFAYTRILGDLRSVLRLSPATTLTVRVAAGHGAGGTLPKQRQFPLGGPDALRAHSVDAFSGDQLALAQAEYLVGLGRLHSHGFEGGLHAIAFVDAGSAWSDPRHRWNVQDQHFAVDGGFGFAIGEDNLRIYLSKNLQDTASDLTLSARLHRPF